MQRRSPTSVSLSPWAGGGVVGIVQTHSQNVQGAGEDLQREVEQSDSEAWWGWGRGGGVVVVGAKQTTQLMNACMLASRRASFGKQGRKFNAWKSPSVAN